jgi:broad specificity phosphatase PhoE
MGSLHVSPAESLPELLPSTRLFLIRHAEVEAAYQGVFGGVIDMELSPRGHQQARALATYLRRVTFDAVFVSPMKRVQQTLAALAANGIASPIVRTEFREMDFGIWTGLAWEETQTRYGVSAWSWLDQIEAGAIPRAETGDQLRARVEPPLHSILRAHSGQCIAIFCHGGIIRVMLSILLQLPLARTAMFEVDYASVTQVLWPAAKPRLALVNFTPWRDLAS